MALTPSRASSGTSGAQRFRHWRGSCLQARAAAGGFGAKAPQADHVGHPAQGRDEGEVVGGDILRRSFQSCRHTPSFSRRGCARVLSRWPPPKRRGGRRAKGRVQSVCARRLFWPAWRLSARRRGVFAVPGRAFGSALGVPELPPAGRADRRQRAPRGRPLGHRAEPRRRPEARPAKPSPRAPARSPRTVQPVRVPSRGRAVRIICLDWRAGIRSHEYVIIVLW